MDAETPRPFFQRFGKTISALGQYGLFALAVVLIFSPLMRGIAIFMGSALVLIPITTWLQAGMLHNQLLELRSKAEGELPPMPTPRQLLIRSALCGSLIAALWFIAYILVLAIDQYLTTNLPPDASASVPPIILFLYLSIPLTGLMPLIEPLVDMYLYRQEGIYPFLAESHHQQFSLKALSPFGFYLFLFVLNLVIASLEIHYQKSLTELVPLDGTTGALIVMGFFALIYTLPSWLSLTDSVIRFRIWWLSPKLPDYEKDLLSLERDLSSPVERQKRKKTRTLLMAMNTVIILGFILVTVQHPAPAWVFGVEIVVLLAFVGEMLRNLWIWKEA